MRKAIFVLWCVVLLLVSAQHSEGKEKDEVDVKEIAETWFTKQATGSLGKKFLEKVKCKKFVEYFEESFPSYYGSKPEANKLQVVSVCEKQRQIERDRRDLQDYAVRYFRDPEETELSTCKEFADDFISEYPKFKGERGEAEAYCYHFKEEGSLKELRKVQEDHQKKTRTMEDAVKTAKEIHADSVHKDLEL